ncbi:MAG: O-antigen export system, permease protein [uncultured Aureispira sp.]|uniref:Transport permease protein n=1 Tax=uncultured Aureispira sp. TaxID=1331704 RepID=A0A6S6ULJ6_9BACT|nr:MAG: O-antigen export system, permease protein [uncultured Aureispira sp.]
MKENWDLVIKPHKGLLDVDLKELWDYRDLLFMFVKRDIVTVYKQTVLGPLWFIVQPVLTMLMFMVVFGTIAKIEVGTVPPPLFYLAGIIIWTYFSDCFIQTSDTFTTNANIFGKVYFPRLIMPLSKVVSGLVKFFIQLVLFLIVYLYYGFSLGSVPFQFSLIWLLPILVILMAGLGLGFGLIFSAMTTKYRDLKFLLQFGVQLLMYATPVIYPASNLPDGTLKQLMFYNPLSHIVESFKRIFLGEGMLTVEGLIYASVVTFAVLILGILIFNRTERSFVDTV